MGWRRVWPVGRCAVGSDDDLRRLERHVDSLLQEFGVLKVEQIRHEERINDGRDDRVEIRAELAKLEVELLAAIGRSEERTREHIGRVAVECHGFWAEYRRDREKALERREHEREQARKQLEHEREEARKQLARELEKARELAQEDARDDKEWSRRKKLAVIAILGTGVFGSLAAIITAAAAIWGS